MKRLTNSNKLYIYHCYKLMRDCVSFEHIEDSEFIYSAFDEIERYSVATPPELYENIKEFVTNTLYPIVDDPNFFSVLNEKEFGDYDYEGSFRINSVESLNKMVAILCRISIDLEQKVDTFFKEHMSSYLIL